MSGRHAAPTRRALALRLPGPATIGALAALAAVAIVCYAGPVFYHPDLQHVNLLLANRPPGAGGPLGTDQYGRDILGLLMVGGRVSLQVGIAAGLLSALIGAVWGAVAGYLGGAADALMMRLVDAAFAIPALVLVLLLSSIYQPSPGLLVLVIAATSWLSTARLIRGEALMLRSREFVRAVQVMGGGRIRIIATHIGPNVLAAVTVSVTLQIADAILILATLSYLHLGVLPPSTDWGDMIASGIAYINDGYWWEIIPVGLAIMSVVVAFNLLGDGLSDDLSPGGRR